jgi:AsmA family protein
MKRAGTDLTADRCAPDRHDLIAMRRIAKVLAWSAGILVAVVAIAAGTIYVLSSSDYIRGEVESRAGQYSGRKIRIAKMSIDWGSTSHIRLEGVEVANADWGRAKHMLKAEKVEFDIRLWPLLGGDIVMPHLALAKPEVELERGDQDQFNWSMAESPVTTGAVKATAPEERHEMPLVGRFEIIDGKAGYRDAKRRLELDGTISTASGKAGDQPQTELSLKGKLEGQPLDVRFVGGSALMLRETDTPYPVDLDVSHGATKLTVKGTLQDPIQWKGASVELAVSGQDLSDVFPLLGIPSPPTPPYRITGKLDREPGVWKLQGSKWRVGDSNLSGDIRIDERSKPSQLTAKLVSQHLVFADLAPLIGASPGRRGNLSPRQRRTEEQLEATGDLFPNVPLHLERLKAMNMDVSLDAKRVLAPPYVPVQALSARVHVDDGRATVRPLTLAAAGGTITGEIGIDAQAATPKVRTALALQDLDISAFFRGSRFFDTTRGKVRGRVLLAGSGRSLAEVMGTADGHVAVAMAGGYASGLFVSLAGLQIADALILYITGDNRIPIRCALARLNLRRGTVTFDKTLLDTQKSVLHVDGQVALKTQAVNIKVSAEPKKFDLLNLHGPVLVKGKIRSPSVSIDRAIPIPTPVLGAARDIPCEDLTRQLLRVSP